MTKQTPQKSFILYNDTYEHIKSLSLADKGKLLDAIFNHANNNAIEVDGVVAMAFSFIKSQMDRDADKYNKFIEKQRANGLRGGRPKDSQSKPKNPPLNRDSQKSLTDTDTDTDTVNDKCLRGVSCEPLPPAPKKISNGCRLPDNWELSDELGEWAESLGLRREQILIECDKFRDYWWSLAGAKATKKDWDAVWRNWIRRKMEN